MSWRRNWDVTCSVPVVLCAPQGCSLLCIPGLLRRFLPTCRHIPTAQAFCTMADTVRNPIDVLLCTAYQLCQVCDVCHWTLLMWLFHFTMCYVLYKLFHVLFFFNVMDIELKCYMFCSRSCNLLCIPGLLRRFSPTRMHIPTAQALCTMVDTVPNPGRRIAVHSTAAMSSVWCVSLKSSNVAVPLGCMLCSVQIVPCFFFNFMEKELKCEMLSSRSICLWRLCNKWTMSLKKCMHIRLRYCHVHLWRLPICFVAVTYMNSYVSFRFTSVFLIAIPHTYVSTTPPNMFGTHTVTCRTPSRHGWWLIPVLRRTSLALSNPTLTSVTTITAVLVTESNPLRFGKNDARAMSLQFKTAMWMSVLE